jgi:hypothetical protein
MVITIRRSLTNSVILPDDQSVLPWLLGLGAAGLTWWGLQITAPRSVGAI